MELWATLFAGCGKAALAFPYAVNGVVHSGIASYAHFHNAFSRKTTYKLIYQTDIDKTYSMPKSHVSYRKPRRLSDAQGEQARQKILKINSDGGYRSKS